MAKKKADLNKMSLEELERYIEQLKEPVVVKPVKKNKGGGLNAAIERVKRVQGMEDGGEALSLKDRAKMSELREKLKKAGDPRANDRDALIKLIKPKGMEDGGEVPKKFKGFSKLPEDVQQQMNPTLAAKYEDGGVVRGMGRAYMGKPRKVKIR